MLHSVLKIFLEARAHHVTKLTFSAILFKEALSVTRNASSCKEEANVVVCQDAGRTLTAQKNKQLR